MAFGGARFGSGSGPILLDNVECTVELSRGLRIVQAVVSVPTTVLILKMLEYDVCP